MSTIFTDTGEINAFVADGRIVLDAYEEIPLGRDRVHGRKLTLLLTPHDAARLRRDLGTLLRKAPRPSASGPTLGIDLTAEECAA